MKISKFLYSQLFVTPAHPSTSFADQTVIVTGSNVGLGLEAARHITRLGAAKVILAVRNLTAGEEAKKSIEQSTGRTGVVEVWKLDLADYASVKAFAKRAETELDRLDVLLENAGIATAEFALAEDHERTITVNVISTFLLGLLLLPKLSATGKKFPSAPAPRLVIVSSEVHGWASFPNKDTPDSEAIFRTLDTKGKLDFTNRYPVSKLLEVLVVRHIAPAVEPSGVVLNMLNPGLCHSELGREAGWGLWLFKLLLARTTEVGGRTLVASAAAGRESHGAYMNDGKVADDMLNDFSKSEDGARLGKKTWEELARILEDIQPGVSKINY